MSSVTRRQLLASGAIAGFTVGLPARVEARAGDMPFRSCPHCSADLALGDLHEPECIAAQVVTPPESQINPGAIKLAQAQRRSSDKPSTRSPTYGPEPCDQYNCDRCKVQKAAKGGWCYHKNTQGCAVQSQC